MDPSLRAHEAVGVAPLERHRYALHAALLALELIEDLGPEPVPLRPAQVHAQEHLRPVGRLGAACTGRDREDRVALVVLAAEEQARALAVVVTRDRVELAVEVGLERCVAVGARELRELTQVARSLLELAPRGELLAQALCGAEDALRGVRIRPEVGLAGLRV